MEEHLGSILNYQESCEQLKRKLLETTIELQNMRNMNAELLTLLKRTFNERDEAREKLNNLFKILLPHISNNFQNPYFETIQPEILKANSSITESNSSSQEHISSPSLEFSNTNSVSKNAGHVREFNYNYLNQVEALEKQRLDFEDEVIDDIAKGRVLPQKGKLSQAVTEAGPLLHMLFLAGHVPSWRNPPPFKQIKTPPPFDVKDFDSSLSNNLNSLNGVRNALRLNSIARFKNHGLSRSRQRINHYSM